MPKSLIICDRPELAYSVEDAFSISGWSSISLSMNSMLGKASASASQYQCLVLILDAEFKYRFSSVMLEIGALVRNCSRQTSLYFILEKNDDTRFIPWLVNGQTISGNVLNPDDIHQAIETIIQLESTFTAIPGFVSPMDYIQAFNASKGSL